MPLPHAYRAYGLTCKANAEISGFFSEPGELAGPEVTIEIHSKPPEWVQLARKLPRLSRTEKSSSGQLADLAYTLTSFGQEDYFELRYSDGTQFVVDAAGEHVWGTVPESLTLDDLQVYLRGPVMGFLLRRRGVVSLHASAVSICKHAVVLCGASESGKSSTAASLALQGVPVLCDDIAAVTGQGGGFAVQSAYPRICLWPDTVEILLGRPDALPRLSPTWEKCFLPLDGKRASFVADRKSLGIIYLLSSRHNDVAAPRIETLARREALLGLVQNTYMNWHLDREQRAAEFDVLCRVVAQIPVRRVVPHSDPALIGNLCQLILKDAQGLLSGQTSRRMPSTQ